MPATPRQITPADLIPDADYARERRERRLALLPVKRLRRIELGPVCTVHFECYETMLFQVQEMLLTEKGGAAQVPDELAAYNPLIPQGSELVATVMFEIDDETYATEDQLFWMAKLSEEFLSKTTRYRDILLSLYQHQNATNISRAKVLEIPEQRFGMPDMREEHLRVGKSDWLAWAAAVGCRAASRISRNHSLLYFGKASPMNKLIADCIASI